MREKLYSSRKTFFEKLDENIEISVFACRRKYEEEQILPDYGHKYAQEIAEKLSDRFKVSYRTEIYIAVKSPLATLTALSGIGTKNFNKEQGVLMSRADDLDAKVQVLVSTLQEFKPEILTHTKKNSSLIAFWSYLLNGGTVAHTTSQNTQGLDNVIGYSDIEFRAKEKTTLYNKIKKHFDNYNADASLYENVIGEVSKEISKGNNAFINFSGLNEQRYASILFLKHYPQKTDDKLFDNILSIQKEFCLIQHFTPTNKEVVLEKTNLKINQLNSFGSFADFLIGDLRVFAAGLSADDFVQLNHSMHLLVFGDTMDDVGEGISSITSALGSRGINVKREEGFTEAAYWSAFPDYEDLSYPRRVPITSETAADFCTFGSKPFGNLTCSFGDHPVSYFKTPDGSNYAFTFHPTPDHYVAGHSLIIGSTGSGKTLTSAYLISQCLKYHGLKGEGRFKALIFDSLNGLKVPTKVFDGDYIDINDESGFIPLNPMQLPESNVNKAFLENWIVSLVGDVSDIEREQIRAALRANYRDLEYQERRLNALRLSFGVDGYDDNGMPRMRQKLQEWMPNEDDPTQSDNPYGMFFNAPTDALDFEKQLVGFDLTFLKDNPKLLAPLTSYLFHRFTDHIDRNPAPHMWFIDEAINFVSNPIIWPQIQKALKEWRKRNGLVMAAVQDLESIAGVQNGQDFIQSFQTYIVFKDSTASPENYMGKEGRAGIGLNEAEFKWVKSHSGGKREVMIKRKSGESVILDIDLSPLGKHLNLLRSEKQVLQVYETFKHENQWQEKLMNSF